MITAKKPGRPTREESVRRLIAGSPNLSQADVRRLLSALAVDGENPAHVRMTGLRALLNAAPSADPAQDREIEWHDAAE